ncbi:hypothetical protein JK635_04080 [Neobacillus sp. YIM B02564]|uniref:Type II secretion system protein n=1 Tax=Neobacillus paridis TaxID=2803862 RepID=A0ABS1TKY9_9BACI|nr:hypothetical protein [Neobacillus paridis]MBL4951419.1 hypothetical protein [Neobacillus paridis]
MLKNNKGFFLLELLLSLAAVFMIGIYLIPLFIDLREQSINLEMEKKARQIMYEELQAKLNDSQAYTSGSLSQNGVNYQIHWNDRNENGLKEVCVSADGKTRHSKIEVCGKLE